MLDEEQPAKPLVLDVTAYGRYCAMHALLPSGRRTSDARYSNGAFRVKILEKQPIRPRRALLDRICAYAMYLFPCCRHEVQDALVDDLHKLETLAHIEVRLV